MIAEVGRAGTPPDQVKSPAAVTHPRRERGRIEPTSADPVGQEPVVTDLVTRARNGDAQAWDALVERYAPLVWSICRRHRLDDADAKDVGQIVWLHLVDQLDRYWTPRPSRMRRPGRLRRSCWWPSATRRYARRSETYRHGADG